jgi:hypothetical protein
LGEKLTALGRIAEAETNYHKLLQEAPNYPDKTVIATKILSLEPKTNGQ